MMMHRPDGTRLDGHDGKHGVLAGEKMRVGPGPGRGSRNSPVVRRIDIVEFLALRHDD